MKVNETLIKCRKTTSRILLQKELASVPTIPNPSKAHADSSGLLNGNEIEVRQINITQALKVVTVAVIVSIVAACLVVCGRVVSVEENSRDLGPDRLLTVSDLISIAAICKAEMSALSYHFQYRRKLQALTIADLVRTRIAISFVACDHVRPMYPVAARTRG